MASGADMSAEHVVATLGALWDHLVACCHAQTDFPIASCEAQTEGNACRWLTSGNRNPRCVACCRPCADSAAVSGDNGLGRSCFR